MYSLYNNFMDVRLIICEKPSIAKDVANALGAVKDGDKYRKEGVIITYCLGHLITLGDMEDYGRDSKKTSDLPFIPKDFIYKERSEECKKRLHAIGFLLSESDILVNACDAGREGELIFRLVKDYCSKYAKKEFAVERMWIQANTKEGILEAWDKKRPQDSKLDALYDAGKARMEADWIIGVNCSIMTKDYMSKKFKDEQVWSIGRVQTAVLGIINNRHQEITHFIPTPYYVGYLAFPLRKDSRELYNAKLQVPDGGLTYGNQKGLFESSREIKMLSQLIKRNKMEFWAITDEEKYLNVRPPLLFNLSELQQTMNKMLGWSGTETLKLLQGLYERGLVSYPRTSSKNLPTSMNKKVEEIYNKIAKIRELEEIKVKDISNYKKLFDNKKVTDHFGLIPWEVGEMNETEEKLWNIIVNRFILCMQDIAQIKTLERLHEQTLILSREGFGKKPGDTLHVSAKITFKKMEKLGWMELAYKYNQDTPLDEIPNDKWPDDFKKTTLIEIDEFRRNSNPAEHYTEELLLKTMDKLNLGTPATRSNIIDILLNRMYIKKVKRGSVAHKLLMGMRGLQLVKALKEAGSTDLLNPMINAAWDSNLKAIEECKPFLMDTDKFKKEVIEVTENYIKILREDLLRDSVKTNLLCPKTNEPIVETREGYIFPGFKDVNCPKRLWGVYFTKEQYYDLFSRRTAIGPFRFKSKRGRRYKANVIFNIETNRIEKEYL